SDTRYRTAYSPKPVPATRRSERRAGHSITAPHATPDQSPQRGDPSAEPGTRSPHHMQPRTSPRSTAIRAQSRALDHRTACNPDRSPQHGDPSAEPGNRSLAAAPSVRQAGHIGRTALPAGAVRTVRATLSAPRGTLSG